MKIISKDSDDLILKNDSKIHMRCKGNNNKHKMVDYMYVDDTKIAEMSSKYLTGTIFTHLSPCLQLTFCPC